MKYLFTISFFEDAKEIRLVTNDENLINRYKQVIKDLEEFDYDTAALLSMDAIEIELDINDLTADLGDLSSTFTFTELTDEEFRVLNKLQLLNGGYSDLLNVTEALEDHYDHLLKHAESLEE